MEKCECGNGYMTTTKKGIKTCSETIRKYELSTGCKVELSDDPTYMPGDDKRWAATCKLMLNENSRS